MLRQSKSLELQEPFGSPFALAHGGKPLFEVLAEDPERRDRFYRLMQFMASGELGNMKHALTGFDWSVVDKPGSTVIDLGGGYGQLSGVLAKHTKHVQFVVQDVGSSLADAEKARAAFVPPEVEKPVQFMEQDLFELNKTTFPVDLVFMRMILHDWGDKHVVKILRNLVPIMKPGSQILIIDQVLKDEVGVNVADTFELNMDLSMWLQLNGKERTLKQFCGLLKHADEKFVWKKTCQPIGSYLSFLHVMWGEV